MIREVRDTNMNNLSRSNVILTENVISAVKISNDPYDPWIQLGILNIPELFLLMETEGSGGFA